MKKKKIKCVPCQEVAACGNQRKWLMEEFLPPTSITRGYVEPAHPPILEHQFDF